MSSTSLVICSSPQNVRILYFPAGYTDKVVMMALVFTIIVIELPVGVDDFVNDSALGKFLEITVHRGKAELCELTLQPIPDFFRGQIYKLSDQNIQDSQPFRGNFKTHSLQSARPIQPFYSIKSKGFLIVQYREMPVFCQEERHRLPVARCQIKLFTITGS